MPKENSRTHRIADQIQKTVALSLRREFKDPRVGMITVMDVKVSSDLRNARVYVSVLESDKTEESIRVLNKASGFFRSCLANQLKLRIVPNLHFSFDESVIRGNRICSLLESYGQA